MFGIGPIMLGLFLLVVVPVLEIRLGLGAIFCLIGAVLGTLIAHDATSGSNSTEALFDGSICLRDRFMSEPSTRSSRLKH
jgi:hypothetical protein